MADLVDPDKPESDAAYINRKHSEGVAEAAKIPKWCPVCEPERDPVAELLIEEWCFRHIDSKVSGDADTRVNPVTRNVTTWGGPEALGF